MRSDNWNDPKIINPQKIRGKSSGSKSNIRSAKEDRRVRRIILDGYPVHPFSMSSDERDLYFSGDSIVCLLCGKKYRTLGGPHLQKIHSITVDQYKEMYGLPYSRGLACGELYQLRAEQAYNRVISGELTLIDIKQYDFSKRKKARLSFAAIEARKKNIKIATDSKQ